MQVSCKVDNINVPHVSNYGQHFFALEIAISGVSKDIFHHISKLASFGMVCEEEEGFLQLY